MTVDRIENGKGVEEWEVTDMLEMHQQVDVVEPPGE
jgi:predicted ester cyclase